jgi:hypothetical protein
MPFNLQPFAAVLNGYVTRFIDSEDALLPGEIALPVVADPDPELGPMDKLWGPDYEVLPDKIRAYGKAVPMEPHEIVRLTFAQLLIGLVTEGWITEAEGEGWLAGTLPAPVLAVIGQLPENQRFAAKARAIRPSEVLRRDPLVQQLGQFQNKSAADLDAFFATYMNA